MEVPGGTSLTVVELAAAGDETAFRALVDAHHEDVLRLCAAITRESDLAADAAQATWIRAWQRLGSLRDRSSVRPWLLAIAANEAKGVLRRRRARPAVDLSAAAEAIARDPDPASRVADLDLAAALARLDPDDRALLALRYVAGLDATELSVGTGLSAPGTRARLARLLARLRKELGDD